FGHTILYANQLFVIFTALIWIKPLTEIFVDSLWNPFFNHSILLAILHEAILEKRYNIYVELAQATFGTATALILIGGETMKLFFQIVCGPTCTSNSLTTVEWYLVFTSLSIVLSQLSNLNSIIGLSLIGVVTAITYSIMVWVPSVSQQRPPSISYEPLSLPSSSASLFLMLNALGIVAFSFRGHNLALEIQATMPSTFRHSARHHLDAEHLDKECGKGPKIFSGYSDFSWLSIRKAKSTIKLGMAGRLCIFPKSIVTPQEFVHEGTLSYRLLEGKMRYDAVIVVVVASFVMAALMGCGHPIPDRCCGSGDGGGVVIVVECELLGILGFWREKERQKDMGEDYFVII
ncbi:hypothetical protein HN51_022569, partial [Arachis hypogaea]